MTAAARTGRRLALLLDGLTDAPVPDIAVGGLALDSRRVQPGDAFLATRGVHGHGLDHVDEAVHRGAAAIVWEPTATRAYSPASGAAPAQIAVPDLARQVGEIAARWHGRPSRAMTVAGITGTDGKTSVAWLLAQAWNGLALPAAYIGTLGSGRPGRLQPATHTTPDPLQLQARLAELATDGVHATALEVSSHALDQDRVAGTDIDIAVLTNVGRDHLDYHGSVEAYAAAKRRLFARPGLRAAVLNGADACGARWAAELGAEGWIGEIIVYGLDAVSAPRGARLLLGEAFTPTPNGLSLRLCEGETTARLDSPLLGRFNAENLLAAAGALRAAGVPLAEAARALAAAPTVPGRIEAFRAVAGEGPTVVVDYAHTPQALGAVLAALRPHCTGRLTAVFGCGGDKDRGKRPLMARAAFDGADALILTDDNPRSEAPAAIVTEMLAGLPAGHRARVIHDRATAITTAVRTAIAGDVVLVAGKGHEDQQLVGAERRPHSDRVFVADLLGLPRRP